MTVRIAKPSVNIREKLAELERPIGLNGQALLATETPQQAFDLLGAGRRNLVINGDFKISQRGDYSSATAASHSTYYLDRWKTDISGPSATIQRQTVTLPDNSQTYSAKLAATSTVSNGYLQLQQFVEIFPYMQGRTVTMSVWVRSNRQVRLRMESTTGNLDGSTAHSGSGNWEYITQTFTLGTGLSLLKFGVILWNSSGGTTATATGSNITSGDYLEFANYQVEFGKVATPFEYRSIGEELALCQRYYERWTGTGSIVWYTGYGYATQLYLWLPYKVPKRTSPSGTGAVVSYSSATPNVLFNAYGTGSASGLIGPLMNSSPFVVASTNTDLSFYINLSASTYTPYGTAVLWGITNNNWIDISSEL